MPYQRSLGPTDGAVWLEYHQAEIGKREEEIAGLREELALSRAQNEAEVEQLREARRLLTWVKDAGALPPECLRQIRAALKPRGAAE
jgi:hypothetical protein